MPNPAASLPVAYQTLARQAQAYGDIDPTVMRVFQDAAVNWNHPNAPALAQAIAAVRAKHPEFSPEQGMSWQEWALGVGLPAAMFALPALGLWGGGTTAAAPSALADTAPAATTSSFDAAAGGAGMTGAAPVAGSTPPPVLPPPTKPKNGGISNWLSPLLGAGLSATGQLVGAKIQSTGVKEAAEIQAKSIANALDFEKARYGDLVGRLTPYIASGATSTDRMSQLLGLPPRSATTATPTPNTPVPSSSPPVVTPSGPTQGGGGAAPVLMRAPDGSVRPVPPELVAKFQGLGATMVNG